MGSYDHQPWASRSEPDEAMAGADSTTTVGRVSLVSLVLMIDSAARGVSAAKSRDEVEIAITTPLSDHLLRHLGVTLIGGLIALVALIIYGFMRVANQ